MKTKFCLMLYSVFAVLITMSLHTQRIAAQDSSAKDPLKVIFLGDSITEAGVSATGYVTKMGTELADRNVGHAIEIIGKGVSGNRVPDLLARLEQDVLGLSPNLVVIYIGINDVWHSANGRGTSKEDYEQGLTSIINQISANGARVILCTPSVIGEKVDGSNSLDKMLDEYSAISRKVAIATGATLVDLRQRFLNELRIANTDNAEKGLLTSDGVHLNRAGNEFVKDCLLHSVESVLFAKTLRHVVLVKFKPQTLQVDINCLTDAFNRLKQEIDMVVSLESGTDISPEGLSQGYTHAFVLTFANAADRDAYLVHPKHQTFVDLIKPHMDGVAVVDFWAR